MKNKYFDTFGVMIDMSRNAVMSVEGLKKYLPILKKMGYNSLLLYTEDVYEIEEQPYFGYMRGRYSKEELKELDAFAESIGMTIIPCIQTLAHLEAFVRWGKVPVDYRNILLPEDEQTYEFIDQMFKTTSECFKSRRIHVGMDEAWMLGRGKYLDLHGYEKISTIMKRHLDKVMEIAKKYDYEIMLWSDMYFRQWNNGNKYAPGKCQVPQEIIESFPQEAIPVYWDYYKIKEEEYDDMIYNHLQISKNTWFAGGAWCWYGITPFNKFTINSMCPAMDACRKNGIRNVFMTLWGDDGAECSRYSVLASLYYVAQYAQGITDMDKIRKGFKRIVGAEFDDFMKLDLPNDVVEITVRPKNPSKYMMYSDYFLGFLDWTAPRNVGETYAQYAKELYAVAKKSRKYGYLFDCAAKHCELLELKFELGLKTREAYEAGDKAELRRLAVEDYTEVAKRFKKFGVAFQKQWNLENKPHGFDVQDHRLGAMIYRTEDCKKRILAYVNGEVDSIPELEEKILPYGSCGKGGDFNKSFFFATPNIVYHNP